MLEADEDDRNGGIFSLPIDFTLLSCPPKGKKPLLLKKFGTWNESVENWSKYPIHHVAKKGGIFLTASSDVSSKLKSTLNSGSPSCWKAN